MKSTIHRVYGPKQYYNEGIRKYSDMYRQGLESQGYNIRQYTIPFGPRSVWRFIYQFIIIPLLLVWNTKKNDSIIFYEEFYTPLTFFFSKNTYYIIHHINPAILQKENVGLLGKLFIKLYLSSLKRLKKAQGIITVSKHSQQEIIKMGIPKNKIHILYNSFDDNIFKPGGIGVCDIVHKRYNIQVKKKIFCHISVFHPRKNFGTIIESLSELKESFHLVKIGSILDQTEYRKNINALKKHNISYTHINNLDDEKTAELLQGCDVFLFSSIFEGFGRSPILAQLCGCPVISTNGGALKEILGNSCYNIVDPYDPKQYIDGIKKILSDDNYKNTIIQKGFINSNKYKLSNLIEQAMKIFP